MEKEMFGKLVPLMSDKDITEIMVNGTEKVFIEKDGVKSKTDVKFDSDEELNQVIKNVFGSLGKRIDERFPYGDVCLADGTRINAVLYPVSRTGPCLTIRKFAANIKTLDDLIQRHSLNDRIKDFLTGSIKGKLNILFSGGTGVGKTTLLKILGSDIDQDDRIIIIEDAPEIILDHPNCVYLESRTLDEEGKVEVTLRELLRNALRMRPDRIILGEIRGQEAMDLLQAMSTGHRGTLAVIHGNTPREVILRLETLVKFSGLEIPSMDVRNLIASTLHMIVHLERFTDGTRKVVRVTEVRGVERGQVELQDIYVYKKKHKDADGKIHGEWETAFKAYPLFFQDFKKEGIMTEKVFF